MSEPIRVFGSNKLGVHGAGAALDALNNHGAQGGNGVGRQGNSYAIPTKATPYVTLSLGAIRAYVADFIEYARAHPETTFQVTRIGTGLAGYTDAQIAPLFADAPPNCLLSPRWEPWVGPRPAWWENPFEARRMPGKGPVDPVLAAGESLPPEAEILRTWRELDTTP